MFDSGGPLKYKVEGNSRACILMKQQTSTNHAVLESRTYSRREQLMLSGALELQLILLQSRNFVGRSRVLFSLSLSLFTRTHTHPYIIIYTYICIHLNIYMYINKQKIHIYIYIYIYKQIIFMTDNDIYDLNRYLGLMVVGFQMPFFVEVIQNIVPTAVKTGLLLGSGLAWRLVINKFF